MSHHFKTSRPAAPHAWKRQDRTEALLRKTCAMIRNQAELDKLVAQFAAGQEPERRGAAQRELFQRMLPHLHFSASLPAFLEDRYVP